MCGRFTHGITSDAVGNIFIASLGDLHIWQYNITADTCLSERLHVMPHIVTPEFSL